MRPTYRTVEGSVSAVAANKNMDSEGVDKTLLDSVVKAQTESRKAKEELANVKKENELLRKQLEENAKREAETVRDLNSRIVILESELNGYRYANSIQSEYVSQKTLNKEISYSDHTETAGNVESYVDYTEEVEGPPLSSDQGELSLSDEFVQMLQNMIDKSVSKVLNSK